MKSPVWSASVMCANLGRLEEDIQALEASGCHELHFDIMDGRFVPNIALGFDFIKMARSVSKLPCDAHLMVEAPERWIDRCVEAGCRSISIHLEACTHVHRALNRIRETGAVPGIAINPATPLTKLQYLLPSVDRILLMTVDPGYAGQKLLPVAFERVKILKENLAYLESRTVIQVDGNIDAANAGRLWRYGAENFVLGTAGLFTGGDLKTAMARFLAEFQVESVLA